MGRSEDLPSRIADDRDQFLNLLLEDLWLRVRDHGLDDQARARLRRPVERGWLSAEQDLVAAERGLTAMTSLVSRSSGDGSPRRRAPSRAPGSRCRADVPIEVLLARVSRALHGVDALKIVAPTDRDRTGSDQSDIHGTERAIDIALDSVERHLEAASISMSLVLAASPRSDTSVDDQSQTHDVAPGPA